MEDSNDKTKLIIRHKKKKTKKTVDLAAEYSDLFVGNYKKSVERTKPIVKLGMKQKLDHETLKAWVEFSNKYDHIPICIIETRMRNKDSTFLKNDKNTEERVKHIAEHAMKFGYSPEESKKWGSTCDGHPYIYDYVIKKVIEHKNHTPDSFLEWFNEAQHSNFRVSVVLGSDDPHGLYSGDLFPDISCSIL